MRTSNMLVIQQNQPFQLRALLHELLLCPTAIEDGIRRVARPFPALLRRVLSAAGVTLLSQQLETAPILKVSNEQILTQPVSINPRARASQVELRLSASIALTVGGQSIIPEEKLTVVRTYFQDIENIAGNQEEAQIIANELRQELINQLMRRLESVPE